MTDPTPRIVFVSGLSGSGKTTAMAALEDQSFYCVDNLPSQLIEQLLGLCANTLPPIEQIAFAIDSREVRFLRELPAVIRSLRETHPRVDVIFLEASNAILVDRYRETRRVHPLAPDGTVEEGIESERRVLVDVAQLADKVIDTTKLNVHELKSAIIDTIAGNVRPMVINISSFGFRYGSMPSAELLFDVRFLRNPYFESSLRERTGLDPDVAEYVLGDEVGTGAFDRMRELCEYLLPLYDREGKAYLTIGIGCTGGRHRSVVVAEKLAAALRASGRELNVDHRDVGRSQ